MVLRLELLLTWLVGGVDVSRLALSSDPADPCNRGTTLNAANSAIWSNERVCVAVDNATLASASLRNTASGVSMTLVTDGASATAHAAINSDYVTFFVPGALLGDAGVATLELHLGGHGVDATVEFEVWRVAAVPAGGAGVYFEIDLGGVSITDWVANGGAELLSTAVTGAIGSIEPDDVALAVLDSSSPATVGVSVVHVDPVSAVALADALPEETFHNLRLRLLWSSSWTASLLSEPIIFDKIAESVALVAHVTSSIVLDDAILGSFDVAAAADFTTLLLTSYQADTAFFDSAVTNATAAKKPTGDEIAIHYELRLDTLLHDFQNETQRTRALAAHVDAILLVVLASRFQETLDEARPSLSVDFWSLPSVAAAYSEEAYESTEINTSIEPLIVVVYADDDSSPSGDGSKKNPRHLVLSYPVIVGIIALGLILTLASSLVRLSNDKAERTRATGGAQVATILLELPSTEEATA